MKLEIVRVFITIAATVLAVGGSVLLVLLAFR
jgi:hypothetical protein